MAMPTTGGGHPGMPYVPQAPSPLQRPGTMNALSAATAPAPPPNYAAQYQAALGQAQSGIHQQLGADLGYIQSQQAAAGQALGQLPGGVNAAYNQALGTIGGSDKTISSLAAQAGLGGKAPGEIGTNGQAPSLSAYMAPVTTGIEGSRAAALANVPLLNIGIQQQANQERASALQGAAGDQQALTLQQMQFLQSQQAAQQSQQDSQANALTQFGYNQRLQDDPNRNFGPSANSGTTPLIDPKTGLPTPYTANQLTQQANSPNYAKKVALLNSATDPAQQAIIYNQIANDKNTTPAELAALNDFVFKGSPPPIQKTPVSKAPDNKKGVVGAASKAYNAINAPAAAGSMQKLYSAQTGFPVGSKALSDWMKQRDLKGN